MYKVVNIENKEKWDDLVSRSENNNIFLKSFYLDCLNNKIEYFLIKKKDEIKAGFVAILDDQKNLVENIFSIYSGVFILKDNKIKTSSSNSQKFQILDIYRKYLNENFKNIYVPLSPEIIDVRPFQWHNYHSDFKKRYFIDIKFTSYLNLETLTENNNEFESKLFLNLNETRKQNIKSAIKNNLKFEKGKISQFLDKYENNIIKQNLDINKNQLEEMHKIMTNLEKHNKLEIVSSSFKDKNEYNIVICWDDYKGYYLFGTGSENKQIYSASATLWNSLKVLAQKKINIFDLEGINSPDRGSFKTSFGGNIVPYYTINFNVH